MSTARQPLLQPEMPVYNEEDASFPVQSSFESNADFDTSFLFSDEIMRSIPERRSQLNESYHLGQWNRSGPSNHALSFGQSQSIAHLDFGLFDAGMGIPRTKPMSLDATEPNVPHITGSRQSFEQSNSNGAVDGATRLRQAVDSLQHGPDSQVHPAVPARGAESVQPSTNGTAALSHESGSRDESGHVGSSETFSAPLVIPSQRNTVHPYITNSPLNHGAVGLNDRSGRNVLPLPPILVPSQAHMTPEDISRGRSRSWVRHPQDSPANMPLPVAEAPALKRTKRRRSLKPDHVAQVSNQSVYGPDPDCRIPFTTYKLMKFSSQDHSPPVSPATVSLPDMAGGSQTHVGYVVPEQTEVIPQAAPAIKLPSVIVSSPSGSVGPPLLGVPSSSTANAMVAIAHAKMLADHRRKTLIAMEMSRAREHQISYTMNNEKMRSGQLSIGDDSIDRNNRFMTTDVHTVHEVRTRRRLATSSNASIQSATEINNITPYNTSSLNM